LESHVRLGAQSVGNAIFISGPKRQLMVGTVSPYVHFSFNPERIPDIRFDAKPD
jgi:hypothetical protein